MALNGASSAENIRFLMSNGKTYTALRGDKPLMCAGLIEMWPGRAQAWALLSADIRLNLLALTRVAAIYLDNCPYHRVEAGVRWAELLGFRREGRMVKYGPDQADHWLYARQGAL